jgi:hypothetical protein
VTTEVKVEKPKKEKLLRGSKLMLDGSEEVLYVRPSQLKSSIIVVRANGGLDRVELQRIAGYENFRIK